MSSVKNEVSVAGTPANEFAGWEIFDPQSDLWQARQASADERLSPSDCIRVKTPSQGVTTFDVDGEPAKEIKGILCYVAKRGVVWPHAEMRGSGGDPVFVTDDLVTARRVGKDTGDLPMAGVEKARNADGTFVIGVPGVRSTVTVDPWAAAATASRSVPSVNTLSSISTARGA